MLGTSACQRQRRQQRLRPQQRRRDTQGLRLAAPISVVFLAITFGVVSARPAPSSWTYSATIDSATPLITASYGYTFVVRPIWCVCGEDTAGTVVSVAWLRLCFAGVLDDAPTHVPDLVAALPADNHP